MKDELLRQAFAAVGPAASERELALVIKALHRSGDQQAIALLDAASHLDDEALDALGKIAESAGCSPFDALDLATAWPDGVLLRR